MMGQEWVSDEDENDEEDQVQISVSLREVAEIRPAQAPPSITGPRAFPCEFDEDSDPWAAASSDTWAAASAASRPASVAISGASMASSVGSLTARFARQNAEAVAASIDVAELFRRHAAPQRGPGGCPPPADESGAGETLATRHDISTPSPTAQRRGLWRRHRGVATSPCPPVGVHQRVPDARYMAPELLPQHVQETADSTSFSQSIPLIPSSISVSLPIISQHFHFKNTAIFGESGVHDEQSCIKEDKLFAQHFEGIGNVRLAVKSSFYKEHGGQCGHIIVNSSSGERFYEQVPTSSVFFTLCYGHRKPEYF